MVTAAMGHLNMVSGKQELKSLFFHIILIVPPFTLGFTDIKVLRCFKEFEKLPVMSIDHNAHYLLQLKSH